jgi:hypothetical protein
MRRRLTLLARQTLCFDANGTRGRQHDETTIGNCGETDEASFELGLAQIPEGQVLPLVYNSTYYLHPSPS